MDALLNSITSQEVIGKIDNDQKVDASDEDDDLPF